MNIVSGNAVAAKVFRGIVLFLGPTQPTPRPIRIVNHTTIATMSTPSATTTGEDTHLVSHVLF